MRLFFFTLLLCAYFVACGQMDSLKIRSAKDLAVKIENATLLENEIYGDHERNVFDLLVPKDASTSTPLVIYIHGGGFKHGPKAVAFEKYHKGIAKLLKKEIAFASINYRFLQHSEDGVMSSLNDSKRFLQFIRLHADKYNIDPTRICSFGESAGAGTSLWLGLSDDMKIEDASDELERQSTRLFAIGAVSTQSTYDLLRWEEVFSAHDVKFDGLPDFMKANLVAFYGAENYEELKNEEYSAYRKKLDFLELLSPDDPTIWIQNMSGDGHPLIFDPQHHPLHAAYLKKYADQKGVKNITYAPALDIEDESGENLLEFFMRVLE